MRHWGWQLLVGVLAFIAWVAIIGLLSIDDFEGERPTMGEWDR